MIPPWTMARAWSRAILSKASQRKTGRRLLKSALLLTETLLTVPLFIVSWLVCATVLSVKVGYQMAKSDGDVKAALLDTVLKIAPPRASSPKIENK